MNPIIQFATIISVIIACIIANIRIVFAILTTGKKWKNISDTIGEELKNPEFKVQLGWYVNDVPNIYKPYAIFTALQQLTTWAINTAPIK